MVTWPRCRHAGWSTVEDGLSLRHLRHTPTRVVRDISLDDDGASSDVERTGLGMGPTGTDAAKEVGL
jgi:hypothetical protein